MVLSLDVQTELDGQMNAGHERVRQLRNGCVTVIFFCIVCVYVTLYISALLHPIVFIKPIYTVGGTMIICIRFWVVVCQPHLS